MIKYSFVMCMFISSICAGQGLPIHAERDIRLSTNSGSYINVDISPNGQSIAFDLLGEVFIMPITGGKAKQITKGIPINLMPVWSPDGKKIAILSDRSGVFKLEVLDMQGHVVKQVKRDRRIGQTTFTPLWIKNDSCKLVPDQQIRSISSKNGAMVAFFDGNTLKVLDKLTGSEKVLLNNANTGTSHSSHWKAISHFGFTPDLKNIIISYDGKIHAIEVSTGSDRIIPFKARTVIKLGRLNSHQFKISSGQFDVKYMRDANVSIDGKKLIFQALGKVYIQDYPKGQPKMLLNLQQNQYQPVFSPDGRNIAFVTWEDEDFGGLWTVSIDGGKPVRISSEPGQYQRPCWSPDGKTLAVIKSEPVLGDRDDAGSGNLILFSLDNGSSKIVDHNVPLWNKISFDKDGRHVYYTPGDTDSDSLTVQIIQKDISSDKKSGIGFGKGSWTKFYANRTVSPDKKWITYSTGDNLHLIPISSGPQKTVMFNDNEYGTNLGMGTDPFWAENGKLLRWIYGNRVFELRLDNISNLSQTKVNNRFSIHLKAGSDHGSGSIAFVNARIITMSKSEIIDKGVVIIKDGRIVEVGAIGSVGIPNDIAKIDLNGKTILPGFIDTHLHMRLPENIFPSQPWMYSASLAYGVTTARDPSSSYDSFGYAELLRTGQMTGPRLITVGRAANPIFGLKSETLSEANDIVIKRKMMGGIAVKQYQQHTRTAKQNLLLASEHAGLNMTNEGDKSPLMQLADIKNGTSGIEHNPQWLDAKDDILKVFAKSGTILTPTLQTGYESSAAQYFKRHFWNLADQKMNRFLKDYIPAIDINPDTNFLHGSRLDSRIILLGGKIAIGSHGDDKGIGFHNEIWALAMGGTRNLTALKAATLWGAEALGLQNDLGSIEKNKMADLLILDDNPLEDIHSTRKIKLVIKEGIIYNGNTLKILSPQELVQHKF